MKWIQGNADMKFKRGIKARLSAKRHKVSLLLHELKGFILLPREINGLEKAK